MIEIKLEDQKVLTALNNLAKHSQNLTPAMQEIGEVMTHSTKARFGKGEAPDGKPWAANSPLVARLKVHCRTGSLEGTAEWPHTPSLTLSQPV